MSWELVDTPNPNEMAIRIWVSQGKVLNKSQLPVAGVTLLKDFLLDTAPVSEGYGDYVYMKAEGFSEGGKASGGSRMAFLFGMDKSETDKYTPFDTVPKGRESFYWPNVMERWRAEPLLTQAIERKDPNGRTNFEMKWKAHFRLKPYVDGPAQMERLLYLAPTKFDLQQPVILQTVSFGWELPGDGMEPTRMLIAERIHKPTRVLGASVLSSTTYEPTAPSDWTRHLTFTDQEQQESGLWLMWEDYMIPPPEAQPIRER